MISRKARIYLFLFLSWLLFKAHSAQCQNFQIDGNAIGILKQGDVNMGTAFVCEYPNIIVSCQHTFNNVSNLSFQNKSGRYEAKVLNIELSQDFSILRLEKGLEATPISIDSFDQEIHVGDSVLYYGYDMRIMYNLDTIFPIDYGDARIRSVGKTSQVGIYELDFIDFYGKGIPGYSGGPIVNSKGKLIGVIYKGYQEMSLKTGDGNIVNKGVVSYSLKKLIDQHKDDESIYDRIIRQANESHDRKIKNN